MANPNREAIERLMTITGVLETVAAQKLEILFDFIDTLKIKLYSVALFEQARAYPRDCLLVRKKVT